ncbi:MAG TPA: hypothetical protein EYP98_16095 [Planctomycetes bacterium]|nr:hypothetical protein [Planctomycetota bacterium]
MNRAPFYNGWWGMFGPDPLGVVSVGGIPGTQIHWSLPASPALDGLWVYMQFIGLKAPGTAFVLKGSGLSANLL